MTPEQFKARRLSLGLSQSEFGLALGYGGRKATRGNMISDFERGIKPIPATMKYRLACIGQKLEKGAFSN